MRDEQAQDPTDDTHVVHEIAVLRARAERITSELAEINQRVAVLQQQINQRGRR